MPKRTTPLATLRRRQLLTQRALAEKAGVTQPRLKKNAGAYPTNITSASPAAPATSARPKPVLSR